MCDGIVRLIAAVRILRFARTIRCASVASGTRNARLISATVSPPTRRSDDRYLGGDVERGVTAEQDESQAFVGAGHADLADLVAIDHSFTSRIGCESVLVDVVLGTLQALHFSPPASIAVDGATVGGCHEPATRVVRDAVARPGPRSIRQCVLYRLIGEVQIAKPGGEDRQHAWRVVTRHACEGRLDVRRRDGRQPDAPRAHHRRTASPRRVRVPGRDRRP